jgi:ElaB/YqjD/DUF883 family membrane-anchored ribosome-binding protein
MANETTGSRATARATQAGEGASERSGASLDRSVDNLSDQIETLKADLAGISATLADLVRSGAREGRASVERTAEYYAREGRRQADAAVEGARAYGEALEGQIARNPFSAVLVALGLGFLIGLMSRR